MLSEEQPERGRWGLARLAPAVLVAWVVVDLGLRAMPVERLGVSPIVAAQRFAGRRSPFRASVSISVPAGSPGENAVRGNLPPTERRGPLRFSTDALDLPRFRPGFLQGRDPSGESPCWTSALPIGCGAGGQNRVSGA